jgi:hypothetical protein
VNAHGRAEAFAAVVTGGDKVAAGAGCIAPGNLAARAALSNTAGGRGNGAMAAGLDFVTPMSCRKVKVRPRVYLSTASYAASENSRAYMQEANKYTSWALSTASIAAIFAPTVFTQPSSWSIRWKRARILVICQGQSGERRKKTHGDLRHLLLQHCLIQMAYVIRFQVDLAESRPRTKQLQSVQPPRLR